jgi:hypothetical protein
MGIEDAIHTALLTLKEGYEGRKKKKKNKYDIKLIFID